MASADLEVGDANETTHLLHADKHTDSPATQKVNKTYTFLSRQLVGGKPGSPKKDDSDDEATYSFFATSVDKHHHEEETEEHWDMCGIKMECSRVDDNIDYTASHLSSWNSMLLLKGTVWDNPSLWIAMGWMVLLAFVIAALALWLVKDPASLQVSKFQQLSAFLNVFVGLLLGFFLASSVTRWYACADGFLMFFDAVRNLQMQFHALGVPDEDEATCLRYAVLSSWLLRIELYVACKAGEEQEKEHDKLFTELKERRPGLIKPSEEDFLVRMSRKGQAEPSLLLWTWIASKIGRMAQDGDIPGMATPTYGRIMNILQVAHGGIRTVRGSIAVQVPFIYVHMLATLVHMNNFINAVSFGLTAGTTIGVLFQFFSGRNDREAAGYNHAARSAEVRVDIQNLVLAFFFSIFGPFIYHALLEVAICIAQPFDNEDGELPTGRMTYYLERDVLDAKIFSETLPGKKWEKPVFKVPPK